MHVDRAIGRRVQNVLRQDLAVGRHYDELRCQLLHDAQSFAVPHFHRLVHWQADRQGIFLYRRKRHFVPSVLRLVRLGEHTAHVVPVLHQPLQGRHGEVGRAHEQYPHSFSSPFSASARRMYSSSSSSVSRWSVCSTNRWPSRCSISWQKQRAVRPSSSTSNQLPSRS